MKSTFLLSCTLIFFLAAKAQTNDLAIINVSGQTGISPLGLFYSTIPLSQADSFLAVARYHNSGTNTETNSLVSFQLLQTLSGYTLEDTGTSSAVVQLAPGADTSGSSEFWQYQSTTGQFVIGQYTVAAAVRSDSADINPADNLDSLRFNISDSVYSINNTNIQNHSSFYLIRNNFGISNKYGVLFEVINTDTVTSITTALAGGTYGTQPGSVIQASIYPVTGTTYPYAYGPVAVSTFPRTLTPADLSLDSAGALVVPVSMMISDSLSNSILQPGLYWVAISALSTPDSDVIIAATNYQKNGYPVVNSNGALYIADSINAPYININFGHRDNLLYANFTMTPANGYVSINTPVTFTPITNGDANSSFTWQIIDLFSGSLQTFWGRTLRDTFMTTDSVEVCLTVTDGGDSATACQFIVPSQQPSCSANFTIALDTSTSNSYIGYNMATGANLTYLWNFGDSTTSTQPYPTHVYAAPGNYTVCLTVTDTVTLCTATYCDTSQYFFKNQSIVTLTIVNGLTGISYIAEDNSINIYPNPARDAINIKVNSSMVGAGYTITDVTGRKLMNNSLKQEITTIPISELATGIYFIHLGNRNDNVYKIVKE